ncbi:MAG TPA: hypothetical protein VKI19_01185 [Acidimicrobiales bacterium]|nr:hypothetical protein [Acidimicrobiales bacterium]
MTVTAEEAVLVQVPEEQRRPGPLDLIAAVLLLATVVLHVAAMVPTYFTGQGSLLSQPDQATQYAVLAAAWALALGLGLTGPHRTPAAAALATGLVAAELGLRVVDLGRVLRYGTSTAGSGLWLMEGAWVAGLVATVVAVLAARRRLAQPGPEPGPAEEEEDSHERLAWTLLVVVLAAVTAGLFLPPWDHVLAVSSTTGRGFSQNLGNAFKQPWQEVIGNVLAALALLVVPIVAVRLRRKAVGAALTCGALLVLASQLASAVANVDQNGAGDFGLTPAQARQLHLLISVKLTGWFTLDALAAYALFATVMVRASLRLQASSPGTSPSAPDLSRPATSSGP